MTAGSGTAYFGLPWWRHAWALASESWLADVVMFVACLVASIVYAVGAIIGVMAAFIAVLCTALYVGMLVFGAT